MDWIFIVRVKDKSWALVSMVTNLRAYNSGAVS